MRKGQLQVVAASADGWRWLVHVADVLVVGVAYDRGEKAGGEGGVFASFVKF